MGKKIVKTHNEFKSLIDVQDCAYELTNDRIDTIRSKLFHYKENKIDPVYLYFVDEMDFLKDIRDVLKIGENFRYEL